MARERFWYFSNFSYVVAVGLTLGAIARKDPRIAAPLVPIGFSYAFQYDMCYGNMMERVMSETDTLLVEKPLKFILPVHSDIVEPEEYLRIMKIKDGKRQI